MATSANKREASYSISQLPHVCCFDSEVRKSSPCIIHASLIFLCTEVVNKKPHHMKSLNAKVSCICCQLTSYDLFIFFSFLYLFFLVGRGKVQCNVIKTAVRQFTFSTFPHISIFWGITVPEIAQLHDL